MFCDSATVAWRKRGKRPDGTFYPPFFFHAYSGDRDFLDYYHNCPSYAEPLILPCGKCLLCTSRYRRNWVLRCVHELRYHDVGIFLTLTVNDRYLYDVFPSLAPGGLPSLSHRPFQLFLKRLRITLSRTGRSDYLRYYMCGEYGDLNHRPHYHSILFGYRPDDLQALLFHRGLYVSDELSRLWPYGYHTVANITPSDISYVAGYCDKKLDFKRSDYISALGVSPEYVCMSRGSAKRSDGGLGKRFFDEFWQTDLYPVSSDGSVGRLYALSGYGDKDAVRMPVYYDRLLQLRDPERFARIRLARQVAVVEQPVDVSEWLEESHRKHAVKLVKRRVREYSPLSDVAGVA